MAWTYFPLSGNPQDFVPREPFNELVDAAIERELVSSSYPKIATGQKGVRWSEISALRVAIANGVSAWWKVSWGTSSVTGVNYTTGATSSGYKNIFEDALGASYTDWRYGGSKAGIRRRDLNDIYLVLDKLRWKRYTPSLTYPSQAKSRSQNADPDADPPIMKTVIAAEGQSSLLDAASWGSSAGDVNHRCYQQWNTLSTYYWATSQHRTADVHGFTTTMPLKRVVGALGGCHCSRDLFVSSTITTYNLARTITLRARYGSGTRPTTWAAAASWGTEFFTRDFNTKILTPITLVLVSPTFAATTGTIAFVVHTDDVTHLGADLSALKDNDYPYIQEDWTETVDAGFITYMYGEAALTHQT